MALSLQWGQSLCDEDIQALKHEMAKGGFVEGEGTIESRDVVSDYVADVLSRVRYFGQAFKVVVDAGHGVGAITALPVLKAMNCEIVELFCSPTRLSQHITRTQQSKKIWLTFRRRLSTPRRTLGWLSMGMLTESVLLQRVDEFFGGIN